MQRRDPAKFASQSKDSVLPTLCFPDLQGACSERPYCRQSTYKQSLEICPELCCRLLLASLVTSSFKTQPCQSTPTKIFCKTTVNRIVAVCQVAIRLEMEGPRKVMYNWCNRTRLVKQPVSCLPVACLWFDLLQVEAQRNGRGFCGQEVEPRTPCSLPTSD